MNILIFQFEQIQCKDNNKNSFISSTFQHVFKQNKNVPIYSVFTRDLFETRCTLGPQLLLFREQAKITSINVMGQRGGDALCKS